MSRAEAQRALLNTLQTLAREHVTTAAHYVQPTNNGPVFRRLISSIGLPRGQELSYPIPAESNLQDLATDPSTTVKRLVLAPYGLASDIELLSRSEPQHRQIHDRTRATTSTGATRYALHRSYIRHASLTGDALVSPAKTISQVGAMVAPNGGVSAHFLVTREGLILQTAALDDVVLGIEETGFWQSGKNTDILVCYESVALSLASDFRENRRLFIEAPLTETQANAIAFIAAKVAVAFNITPLEGYAARPATIRPGFTTLNALQKSAGETIPYRTFAFQDDDELSDNLAFVDEVVPADEQQLRLLYGQSSSFESIQSRASVMHFDAATEIYRTAPVTRNEDATTAQAALQQRNTNDIQAFTERASGYVAARMRALATRQLSDSQIVSLRIAEHLVTRDELRAETLNLALSDEDVTGRTGVGRTPTSPGQGELFDFVTGHWTGNGRNVI